MPKEQEELRARDLLPPDDPPPDDRPKRIAERRVVGWFMADRLVGRAERRPAGNSRRFWARIEDDDPFIPRIVPRRVRQDHTLYPADRIDRIPSTAAPPPRPPPAPNAPPQARREAPPPTGRPEPTLNPDPRAARAPITPQTPAPEPPPPVQRRLPPVAPPPERTRSGRIKISSASKRPAGSTGIVRGPTAAEIRAEKEALREAAKKDDKPPPTLRKLDDVLGILGQLKQQQDLHAKGLLDPEAANVEHAPPPPKPKRLAPPPRPAAAPKPVKAPAPPPVDRTPPAPKKPAKPKADKDPPRPPSGGMDDLFGGASEGRVRLGKRAKPADKPPEDGDS